MYKNKDRFLKLEIGDPSELISYLNDEARKNVVETSRAVKTKRSRGWKHYQRDRVIISTLGELRGTLC